MIAVYPNIIFKTYNYSVRAVAAKEKMKKISTESSKLALKGGYSHNIAQSETRNKIAYNLLWQAYCRQLQRLW